MKTEIIGSKKWRVGTINQVADILKQDKRFTRVRKDTSADKTEMVFFTDRLTNTRYVAGFGTGRKINLYNADKPAFMAEWSYEKFKPTDVVRFIKKSRQHRKTVQDGSAKAKSTVNLPGTKPWINKLMNRAYDILKNDDRFTVISKRKDYKGEIDILFKDNHTNNRYMVSPGAGNKFILWDTAKNHYDAEWPYEQFKPTDVVRAIKK